MKLTPEELKNEQEYELLTEVSHSHLKEFVVAQIGQEKYTIRIYSVYQLAMILLFTYFFTRSIVFAIKGSFEMITSIGSAVLFSLSALIIIHELVHALAYLATGARKVSFGAVLRKFIFYAMADRQVISQRAFLIVALAPFVVIKIVCLFGMIYFFNQQLMYFFLTIMCLHSLFCAGDIAMLAFYRIHSDKEIFNFDDKKAGKTYFYQKKTRK